MEKQDQTYFKPKTGRVEIALKSVQSPNQPKNHPKLMVQLVPQINQIVHLDREVKARHSNENLFCILELCLPRKEPGSLKIASMISRKPNKD